MKVKFVIWPRELHVPSVQKVAGKNTVPTARLCGPAVKGDELCPVGTALAESG